MSDDGTAAVLVAGAKARTTPLNQVATRCGPPNTNTAGHREWVGTSVRRMSAAVSRFKIRIDYMHLASLREADPGGPASYMASVEYPTGVHTRVLFSGALKGICVGLGYVESDWINVAIPAGAEWLCTIQGSSLGGSAYVPWNATNLDPRDSYYGALTFTGADYTMGNAPPSNQNNGSVWPSAVVSDVDCPSALLVGDSRVVGSNETIDSTLDLGELARSVGQVMAYISVARSGDYASYFMGDHAVRIDLAQYCTQAIFEYGINDIFNYGTSGFAAARLQRYTDAFLQMIPEDMPAFICTMTTSTTSTDGWTTTVNQTIMAGGRETVRVNENNRRRAVPAGWAGCIELADVSETARNSGIFKPNITADGTHLNQAGNLAIRNANIIQPVLKQTPRPIKRAKRIEPTKGNVNVLPAGKTLLEQETGRGYTNEGATAQTVFALPEALPGLTYTFIVQDADGIRVNAFSSDTIRIGATVSASAGNMQSTAIGSVVTLLAINQVEWVATISIGTWTVT